MIFSSKQLFIQVQAQFIASHLEEAFDSFSVYELDRVSAVMSQLDVAGVTNIVVTDSNGAIVYDSTNRAQHEDFPAYGYFRRAMDGWYVILHQFDEGSFAVSVITPVVSRGTTIGAVYVRDEDPEQGAVMLEMQVTLRNISIGVALFSVVMVALIVWSLMRR
ncbi:MAG: hypothetical protein FWB75_08080, partial [Oscillospiraceae bacterium]|nr:hypothetical protein [Oscillospiraceae bacterium]